MCQQYFLSSLLASRLCKNVKYNRSNLIKQSRFDISIDNQWHWVCHQLWSFNSFCNDMKMKICLGSVFKFTRLGNRFQLIKPGFVTSNFPYKVKKKLFSSMRFPKFDRHCSWVKTKVLKPKFVTWGFKILR